MSKNAWGNYASMKTTVCKRDTPNARIPAWRGSCLEPMTLVLTVFTSYLPILMLAVYEREVYISVIWPLLSQLCDHVSSERSPGPPATMSTSTTLDTLDTSQVKQTELVTTTNYQRIKSEKSDILMSIYLFVNNVWFKQIETESN